MKFEAWRPRPRKLKPEHLARLRVISAELEVYAIKSLLRQAEIERQYLEELKCPS